MKRSLIYLGLTLGVAAIIYFYKAPVPDFKPPEVHPKRMSEPKPHRIKEPKVVIEATNAQ